MHLAARCLRISTAAQIVEYGRQPRRKTSLHNPCSCFDTPTVAESGHPDELYLCIPMESIMWGRGEETQIAATTCNSDPCGPQVLMVCALEKACIAVKMFCLLSPLSCSTHAMHQFFAFTTIALVGAASALNLPRQSSGNSSGYSVKTPPLTTPWTYTAGTNPWPEYPRPQLARSQWQSPVSYTHLTLPTKRIV